MCGIVFAGGNLSASDLEIFNQMLYCDVFRGAHATGIFAKRLDKDKVEFAKASGEPYPFMNTSEYEELTQGKTKYVNAPVFVVGHNRHATRGNAADAKNAHPFQHGDITLVHNGTLTDQSHLPDHARFVVDSENICHSINKIGAAETIQKLDGAFTLIWHDASDDTLHIIRNSERPFHLVQIGQLDWFGASEEDMVMWLLKRSKTHKNRITRHFECEVGVEYVFDVSGKTKKCTLREEIKHDLPTFTYRSRFGAYSSQQWQNDLGNSAVKTGRETARASDRERQNKIALDGGIEARIDQRVSMHPHQWFPYSGIQDRGRITGWVYQDNGEYYEVDVHNVPVAMWERCEDDAHMKLTGTISSINRVNGMVRVVIISPSLENTLISTPAKGVNIQKNRQVSVPLDEDSRDAWEDDNIPFEGDLPASFVMDNGVTMTISQWRKHDHSKCGGCDKTIPWKDAVAGKAILYANAFWHESCLADCLDENSGQAPDTFLCSVCGKEKPMSVLDGTESARRGEDVCIDCASTIIQKRNSSSEEAKGVSVIYTDKSTTAIIDDNDGLAHKIFTREEFSKMIRMRNSDVADFKDLPECYVEKRSKNLYAYMFKRGHKLSNKETEVSTPTSEGSFSSDTKQTTAKISVLSKILSNESKTLHVNKALWSQIGQCKNCFAQIPWRDVESCGLTERNQVICPVCKGE